MFSRMQLWLRHLFLTCRFLTVAAGVAGQLFLPLGVPSAAEKLAEHPMAASIYLAGDHGHADHGLNHCGFAFCFPAYIPGAECRFSPILLSSRLSTGYSDDPFLPSSCLDRDPPVPRGDHHQA